MCTSVLSHSQSTCRIRKNRLIFKVRWGPDDKSHGKGIETSMSELDQTSISVWGVSVFSTLRYLKPSDLLRCTEEPNVSIPHLANLLLERVQNPNWIVVFKSLVTIHHMMCYGNEVCHSSPLPVWSLVALFSLIHFSDSRNTWHRAIPTSNWATLWIKAASKVSKCSNYYLQLTLI